VTDSHGNENSKPFQLIIYDSVLPITAIQGTFGSISPSGITWVIRGGSQTFTIKPNAGYHIADVLIDGNSAGAVTTYTFSNVTTPHTISATFAQNPSVVITANAGDRRKHYTFWQRLGVMGTNQSFSITPMAGYWITNVVVDTVSLGPKSGYTFSNVQTAHTISASFGPTIKATAGQVGASHPAGYLISRPVSARATPSSPMQAITSRMY